MKTYYCPRGCNVFDTCDTAPECGACGSRMTEDVEAFDDAHERRELEGISKHATGEMKTYSALFAVDVPHYGVLEIEAKDDEAALEAANTVDVSEVVGDPEWENAVRGRIVYLRDSDDLTIAEDVSLDNTFMRYGGEEEYRLCEAAPELLDAARAPDP
jgi:hypothetical protein